MSSMLLGSEMEDMEKEDEFYCEMVQLFKDSNGENGWPNFKGIDCEADVDRVHHCSSGGTDSMSKGVEIRLWALAVLSNLHENT